MPQSQNMSFSGGIFDSTGTKILSPVNISCASKVNLLGHWFEAEVNSDRSCLKLTRQETGSSNPNNLPSPDPNAKWIREIDLLQEENTKLNVKLINIAESMLVVTMEKNEIYTSWKIAIGDILDKMTKNQRKIAKFKLCIGKFSVIREVIYMKKGCAIRFPFHWLDQKTDSVESDGVMLFLCGELV